MLQILKHWKLRHFNVFTSFETLKQAAAQKCDSKNICLLKFVRIKFLKNLKERKNLVWEILIYRTWQCRLVFLKSLHFKRTINHFLFLFILRTDEKLVAISLRFNDFSNFVVIWMDCWYFLWEPVGFFLQCKDYSSD